MLYEANIYQMQVEDHTFWVAESKALKGCVGQGETSDEAIAELEQNEKEWIITAKDFNIPIPPRTAKKERHYSGKIALRISPYLHEVVAENAGSLGISINQFINDAIADYSARIREHSSVAIKNDGFTETTSKIIDFPASITAPTYTVEGELEEL